MRKFRMIMACLCGILLLAAPSVKAEQMTSSNPYGITIDGNFEDWADKPKTDIAEPWDDYNYKQGSLLADSDNIYFFIDMSPVQGNGYNTLQPSGYKLTVGNKVFDLTFNGIFNNQDASTIGQKKSLTIYCWAEDGTVNEILPDAQAMVSRVKTKLNYDDIMECKIPIADLKLETSGSQQITLSNSNLGTQTMVVNGGSTGPVVLSSIGLGIAVVGVVGFKKRKKMGTV